MKLHDRTLYHQIHPAKLASDWLTTRIALALFWQHRLAPGLFMTVAPPIVMHSVDLEPYARSGAGRYIRRHMTPTMMVVRLAGAAIMSLGAWWHRPIGLALGCDCDCVQGPDHSSR